MKWYVIHTKVRQEFRAFENLQAQGFEVFLPTCEVQRNQKNQIQSALEPLFLRYLFIRLSDVKGNWFPIRSTRGVAQLLRFGMTTNLVVIPDAVITHLQERCLNIEPLHQLFAEHEQVEITDGPFKGLTGFFEKLEMLSDGLSRALLLVEIFGSTQRLSLSVSQINTLKY